MSRNQLQTHDLFWVGQNQIYERSWEHMANDFSVQFVPETN